MKYFRPQWFWRGFAIGVCLALLILTLTGCASNPAPYAELFIVHEPEGLQDEILKQHRGTPGNQWKGQNPYITGSLGLE